MQPLTAPPRQAFSVAQIEALLVAPDLSIDFGVEQVDASLNVIGDLSPDVSACKISRNNLADIHATCELTISRTLAWGRDRVRPYLILSSATAGVSGAQFRQGVFVVTSPQRELGETPESHSATGFDGMYQLTDCIGDSYPVFAGTNVLGVIRNILTAAGVVAPVLLDSTASAKVTTTHRAWPLTSSESPTWIGVVNDLLASIGYRGLWVDWNGAFRSGPYVLPELRASEFRLDVGHLRTGVVAQERAVATDVFGLPNWMRVVRNGMVTKPVEGNGWRTMTNPSTGPSSIAAVGLRRAPVVFLDATSQADLVTQGARLFANATRSSEVLTFKTSYLPYWHADRLVYADAALGADRQILVRSFELPLDGADMSVVAEVVS